MTFKCEVINKKPLNTLSKTEIVSVDKETIFYLHLFMSNCLVQC